MTNEEAIDLLNNLPIPMILDGKPNEHLAVAHIKAIEALKENTKLKKEIEQLRHEVGNVTSPEKFEEEMKALANTNGYDTERKHEEMDDLMCKLLTELGYASGVDIFVNADKWYA